MISFDELVQILAPSTPPLEIIIRGVLTYVALFMLLRVILKRQSSTMGVADLLVLVLIADAAQNAMADDYTSISDGVLLVATIIASSFAVDWIGYRVPRIGRFVHPPALPLIEDGRLIRENLRRELITREELMSQLRLQGVEEIAEVEHAAMEGNGDVSVVKKDGGTQGKKKSKEGAV